MGILRQSNVQLSIIVYIILLYLNGVKLSEYRNYNKAGAILRIYLLTVGLVVSPTINGILIFTYSFYYFISAKKIPKKSLTIIALCLITSFYIVFNTIFIFLEKAYDPDFNPYIGMFEYIIYFIYYILLRTENYDKQANNLLISHTCLFSVAIFVSSMLSFSNGSILRMSGIFKNPNLLGVYSAVIFALVFFNNALRVRKSLKKLVLVSAGLMLILSFSRVAWLGLIVYLVLFFVSGNLNVKSKVFAIGALLVSGLLIMLYEPVADMISTRIFSSFNLKDYSTSDRIILIQAAWDSFKESPIWGNGIRSFASIVKSGVYKIWSSEVWHPHNAYFEMLQSLGLIGFVLFFCILINSINRKKGDIRSHHIIIMFLTIGLLNRIFNEFSTTMWFWMILSFC